MATIQPVAHPGHDRFALPQRATSNLPVYAAAVLGYLMLLPPQLNLNIAGSELPPYRFMLLGAVVWLLAGAVRRRARMRWPDLAIAATIAWICVAMANTSDWETALTGSIAHFVDIGLAYFFARLAFRSLRDLRMFLLLMLPGLLLTGAIIALESITHRHLIQGALSSLTGEALDYRSDPRMGLMRAQGPFPHPILAGLFMSSFLPLYWLAGFKPWPRLLGALVAASSVFTVSSAAVLSLVAGGALIAYNWLSARFVNLSWSLFFAVSALVLFAAEFGTKSGVFSLFVRFASFNSNSSYARILIWEHGSRNVAQHPWFGIGYADWERPAWLGFSIDNYWMLMAVRFGVIPPVLVGIATTLAIILAIRKSMTSSGADKELERALAMTVGVAALGLISVALWLSTQVWFFMLLGLTVSLASAAPTAWPGSSGSPISSRPPRSSPPHQSSAETAG